MVRSWLPGAALQAWEQVAGSPPCALIQGQPAELVILVVLQVLVVLLVMVVLVVYEVTIGVGLISSCCIRTDSPYR